MREAEEDRLRKVWKRLDVDKSGTLEEEELELLLLVRQPPRTPRQIRAELCS